MRLFFLAFTLLILIVTCKPELNNESISINPLNAIEKEVFLSEFVEDLHYIPLNGQVLFQHPTTIHATKDLIFMATYPEGILAYDWEGNFRKNIGNRGRGPGEYNTGMTFTIDPESGLVYIYDNNRIITYSFGGDLIREFSIAKYDGLFQDIYYRNGKIYLASGFSSGNAKYNWLIIDTMGYLHSFKLNTFPRLNTNIPERSGLIVSPNNIYYWSEHNDTIFKIQDGLNQPFMFFAQGDFRKPLADFPREDYFKYLNPLWLFITKDHFFFYYNLNYCHYSSIIDKEHGNVYIIDKKENAIIGELPGIKNDLDGGPKFQPLQYFTENGEEYLITWFFAYQLKAYVDSDSFNNSTPRFSKRKEDLEKLAASLDENDNQVLMIVRLK